MAQITTKDGTRIFYKDWGPNEAQPIDFHHGWPLSADDWDNQMMSFLAEGPVPDYLGPDSRYPRNRLCALVQRR